MASTGKNIYNIFYGIKWKQIKMKCQPFHHYAAKQGFIKKGIVHSRGKEKGNLREKSLNWR